MVRIDGRDDRLVERGEEHAEHQADEDREDLAVASVAAPGGRGRRRCTGGSCGHADGSWVVARSGGDVAEDVGEGGLQVAGEAAQQLGEALGVRRSQPATTRAVIRSRCSRIRR